MSTIVAPGLAATIGINGSVLTAFAGAVDNVLSVSASATSLVFSGIAFDIVTPGCTGSTSLLAVEQSGDESQALGWPSCAAI